MMISCSLLSNRMTNSSFSDLVNSFAKYLNRIASVSDMFDVQLSDCVQG